jgi:hypothetical protein
MLLTLRDLIRGRWGFHFSLSRRLIRFTNPATAA